MNTRMRDYLKREVQTALAIMIRDNSSFHVFDYDKNGEYVFVMAVVPKRTIPENMLKVTTPICKWCAEGYRATPSVSSANVHTDTPIGRVACTTPQGADTPVQGETPESHEVVAKPEGSDE